MSKKILVMMLIIISAISFIKQPNLNVMADEKVKIEIWSESLNERIEHRSIEVGNSNPNFSIKVTPSDTTIENVTWVTENIGVATVKGNNSTATVYGVSEGSTKLVLSALTKKYGILNYDCVISIYTKINDISGVIKKTTTLYRGADSSSWVRTEKAKLGKKYKYKIVAYYKYITYKNGKLVTERVTKTIISSEITTGTPELKANKQNNKKGVVKNIKLKWNKMSYDYNNKSLKGGYVISRKIGSGKKKQIKTINNKKTTNYTDSKVSKNKNYVYYIKAFYETKSGKKIYSPVRKIEVNTKK